MEYSRAQKDHRRPQEDHKKTTGRPRDDICRSRLWLCKRHVQGPFSNRNGQVTEILGKADYKCWNCSMSTLDN